MALLGVMGVETKRPGNLKSTPATRHELACCCCHARSAAGAHDLLVSKSTSLQRARDDAVRRLTKCNTVFGQALAMQQGNISKIHGAGSSSYVDLLGSTQGRGKEAPGTSATWREAQDSLRGVNRLERECSHA